MVLFLEPLWTIDENNPELGFSWETHVIGRVIDLLCSEVMAKGRFKHLMSTQTERLRSPEDVHQKQNAMHQENDTPFTLLYGNYDVPLLKPSEFRGNVRYVVKDAEADLNFIACIRAIPVAWVMHWFQTEEWARKRKEWSAAWDHFIPPLSKTFMITYVRGRKAATAHRSLHPEIPCDAQLIDSQYLQ